MLVKGPGVGDSGRGSHFSEASGLLIQLERQREITLAGLVSVSAFSKSRYGAVWSSL